MIVRLRVRNREVDEFGIIRDDALRRITAILWDVPMLVEVRIELGPCRSLQELLIRDLALLRCAPLVKFESQDWRVVRDHRDALTIAINEQVTA